MRNDFLIRSSLKIASSNEIAIDKFCKTKNEGVPPMPKHLPPLESFGENRNKHHWNVNHVSN
jgi:hypothetical protein